MNVIIVAMDPQGHIGIDGHMPWRDIKELALFRQLTMHHHILMGRKTWQSILKPLDGRILHVASREPSFLPSSDLLPCRDALALIQEYQSREEVLMICGGEKIYALALPYTDVLYVSVMKQTYRADTCFPKWDPAQFVCVKTIEYETFIWYVYQRKKGAICDL